MNPKAVIREQMRAWRTAQDPDQLHAWSGQVCLHLRSDQRFARAKTIHSFWPMAERGEVDIRPILRSIHEGGRTLWLPVVHGRTLLHATFESEAALHATRFGPLEPAGEPFATVEPEVILVPALAVDDRGNRIGYGGGFYDRFLAHLSALRVGVVFSAQILPSVPADPHDIPLDAIVSEVGWLETDLARND